MAQFKELFPKDVWQDILQRVFSSVSETLSNEYLFDDEADESAEKFTQKAMGQRAAIRWLHQVQGSDPTSELEKVDEYERIAAALVAGIHKPLARLESVCFWRIEPA